MPAQVSVGPLRDPFSKQCFHQQLPLPASFRRLQRGFGRHHAGRCPKLQRLLIVDGREVGHRHPAANEVRQAFKHAVPCGLQLEVLHQKPASGSTGQRRPAAAAQRPPPLLFLHGAMHGAWCWQEHFMPYLAAHGIESYALSLRGHGGSDLLPVSTCSMADQLEDVSSLVSSLSQPPVLVGHSIGGIIVQRYLANLTHGDASLAAVAGAALLANSGPRASMPTGRWFREQRSLWHSARVFWWMLRRPVHDAALVRELFFSADLPEADFKRYHLQLSRAAQVLPISGADMKEELRLGPHPLPPVIVVGGAEDGIVMPFQLQDAADFFGTTAVVLPGVAHDLMLDTRWEQAAGSLVNWLGSQGFREQVLN